MRLFDLFAISEPYEMELLLMKLYLESPLVDKFIICENEYSLRGEFKHELWLKKEIRDNPKLQQYAKDIEVVEMSYSHPCLPGVDDFTTIHVQREAEWNAVQKSSHLIDSRFIVSDADEAINFRNYANVQLLMDNLYLYGNIAPIALNSMWDFDNFGGYEWNMIKMLTYAKYEEILNNPALEFFHKLQHLKCEVPGEISVKPEIPLAYHFHNCYPKADIWRKFNTYGHTGFTEEMLDNWLKYNFAWSSNWNEPIDLANSQFHYEELTEKNSSQYLQQNLARLKTNNLNPDWEALRKQDFPELFK